MVLSIVTGNRWKYTQIVDVFGSEIVTQQEKIDLLEPQSNDMLFVSAQKAQEAFERIWWPVLVDDSGIYFSAYPDFPGVFSKYIFHSLGSEGLRRLFADQQNTKAYFQCVLSYMDTTLDSPMQFVWRIAGEMDFSFLHIVQIDEHLPYDAIFRPNGMEVVAQMEMSTFARMHHRTQAAELCKKWLLQK